MGTRDPLGVLAPLPPAPAVPGGFSHFTDGDGAQSWPQRFKSSRRRDENSGLRSTACPARGSPSASGRLRGATRGAGAREPGIPRMPRAGPRRSTLGETQPRGRREKLRLRSPSAAARSPPRLLFR